MTRAPLWPVADPDELVRKGYNPAAVDAIVFIQSLPDVDVLAAARDATSSGYRQVLAYMERGTNPFWITAQCAEEAYRRGLIDEIEFDYLSR